MTTIQTEQNRHGREILKIAIPSVMESLFTTMSSIIDSKMVSSMGIAAISAVSVTNQPRLFLMCFFFAMNIVASVITAQYIGKKDRDGANKTLITILIVTAAIVAVVSTLSVIFAPQIMIVCSNQPDTMADSVIYFRILMGGLFFNVEFMAINAVLRGCGKTNLTFISSVISCVVNICFNYLLIDGHCGFPALKIYGAAMATVFGNAAAFILCLIIVFRKSSYASLSYCISNRIKPDLKMISEIWGMWNKALPESMLNRVGYLLVGIMASRMGSLGMSVYAVGMHLLNVNFAIGNGLQSASVALIGRSIGAEDRKSVLTYSRKIIMLGISAGIVMGLLIIAFGKPYYEFFGTEADFVKLGQMSCICIGIICPLQIIQIIVTGILQGIGDMKSTLINGIVGVTIVNTTVTFVITILMGGGIYGVWIGTLVCQIVKITLGGHFIRKNLRTRE